MGSMRQRKSSSSRSTTKESPFLLVGHPVLFSRFTSQHQSLSYLLKLTKHFLYLLMRCRHLILSADGLIIKISITSSFDINCKLVLLSVFGWLLLFHFENKDKENTN